MIWYCLCLCSLCLLAYDGDFCENNADGCSQISCINDAECIDNKPPAVGGTCPDCPLGYTGDGNACIGMSKLIYKVVNMCIWYFIFVVFILRYWWMR